MVVQMHHQVAFWKLINLSYQLEECMQNIGNGDEKTRITRICMRCLDSETYAFAVSDQVTWWHMVYDKMTYYLYLSKSKVVPFDDHSNFGYLQHLFTSATSANYEHIVDEQDIRLNRYFQGSLSRALDRLHERIQQIFNTLPTETRFALGATRQAIQGICSSLITKVHKEEKGQITHKIENEFKSTLQLLLNKANGFSNDATGRITLLNLESVVAITDGWVQERYRTVLQKEYKQVYESSSLAQTVKEIREKIASKLLEIEKTTKAQEINKKFYLQIKEIKKDIQVYKKTWEKQKLVKPPIKYEHFLEEGSALEEKLREIITALLAKYNTQKLSKQDYLASSLAKVIQSNQEVIQAIAMEIMTHSVGQLNIDIIGKQLKAALQAAENFVRLEEMLGQLTVTITKLLGKLSDLPQRTASQQKEAINGLARTLNYTYFTRAIELLQKIVSPRIQEINRLSEGSQDDRLTLFLQEIEGHRQVCRGILQALKSNQNGFSDQQFLKSCSGLFESAKNQLDAVYESLIKHFAKNNSTTSSCSVSQSTGSGNGQFQIGAIGSGTTVTVHQNMTSQTGSLAPLGLDVGGVVGSLLSLVAPGVPGINMITTAIRVQNYFQMAAPYLPWMALQTFNIWYSGGLSFTGALGAGIGLTAINRLLSAVLLRQFPADWRPHLKPIFDFGVQMFVTYYAPQCINFFKQRQIEVLSDNKVEGKEPLIKADSIIEPVPTTDLDTHEIVVIEEEESIAEVFQKVIAQEERDKIVIPEKIFPIANQTGNYVFFSTVGRTGS